MTHNPEDLLKELIAAFSERKYPGDENLVSKYPFSEDAEETQNFFRGKSWKEILRCDDTDLRTYAGFLNFDGFAYYLPAFLILGLDPDFDIGETAVFTMWSFPEDIANRLGPAEKLATVHVLEYLAHQYRKLYPEMPEYMNQAHRALDEYWAYFTDEELYGDKGIPSAGDDSSDS